jgi:opacity protein-like surface antigen
MARKVALAVMAVAASIGGPAATATAATSAPAASAACGWTAPLGANYFGNDPQTAEYWLSFNTCNRTVRGAFINGPQDSGVKWELWVYNENSGQESYVWFYTSGSGNIYTGAINDAGTKSHVCVQPYDPDGSPAAIKNCTGYY